MNISQETVNSLNVGEILSSKKVDNVLVTLEVNGDNEEKYLEIVKYVNGIEDSFSEPIYELTSEDDIESYLSEYL